MVSEAREKVSYRSNTLLEFHSLFSKFKIRRVYVSQSIKFVFVFMNMGTENLAKNFRLHQMSRLIINLN